MEERRRHREHDELAELVHKVISVLGDERPRPRRLAPARGRAALSPPGFRVSGAGTGYYRTSGQSAARATAPSPVALNWRACTCRQCHVPVTTLDLENGNRGFASLACK